MERVMRQTGKRRRRGSALLLVIFIMAVTTPLLCLMLNTQSSHIRATHNQIEGMRALYVAQAGVHDAISELVRDNAWRAGSTDKVFPADLGHSYTVTVTDGDEGTIVITSAGQTA